MIDLCCLRCLKLPADEGIETSPPLGLELALLLCLFLEAELDARDHQALLSYG